MAHAFQSETTAPGYFDRPAEKLVLEGYRSWTHGFILRSMEPWTQAQLLYHDLLGPEDAPHAIVALAGFIKTLGQCAACPLRTFRSGSQFICRDEALVMGLIAGIQNCDESATFICLERLCCRMRRANAASAAGDYALTLKAMHMVMKPIPVSVIETITARPHAAVEFEQQAGPTIH